VVKGNNTVYVSSDRDREVVVVDISSPTAGKLIKRIKLDGNALGMTIDASGSKLYVAEDNADQVAVIDTARNLVIAKIDARAPAGLLSGSSDEGDDDDNGQGNGNGNGQGNGNGNGQGNGNGNGQGNGNGHGHGNALHYTGAATFAVTLSRDGKTLYAVNARAASVAVIPPTGSKAYQVTGLIPTAYEPHDITFSADGSWMYIINGKSITGPNNTPPPGHLSSSTARMTTFTGGPAAAAAAAVAAR